MSHREIWISQDIVIFFPTKVLEPKWNILPVSYRHLQFWWTIWTFWLYRHLQFLIFDTSSSLLLGATSDSFFLFSRIHLHPEINFSFMTGYCPQGHNTPTKEGNLQRCVHCFWTNGHWSSSNYSIKSTPDRWSLPGLILKSFKVYFHSANLVSISIFVIYPFLIVLYMLVYYRLKFVKEA